MPILSTAAKDLLHAEIATSGYTGLSVGETTLKLNTPVSGGVQDLPVPMKRIKIFLLNRSKLQSVLNAVSGAAQLFAIVLNDRHFDEVDFSDTWADQLATDLVTQSVLTNLEATILRRLNRVPVYQTPARRILGHDVTQQMVQEAL
jgi:hypothetical protein